MTKHLFFIGLANRLTRVWKNSGKLPLRSHLETDANGLGWTYDEVVWCSPQYSQGHYDFVYHDSSGFNIYGPIVPLGEVFSTLWDDLEEERKTKLMAEILGKK